MGGQSARPRPHERGKQEMSRLRTQKAWPWVAIFIVMAATAFQLHRQGRLWLCSCGRLLLWLGDAWSAETSQQFFDPYSFTHILHGFLFCGLLAWCVPRLPVVWRLWLAVSAEALWEVFENSEFVIRRYRETTAALGYSGDTVVNSLGDIVACALGFVLAQRLGWRRTILAFVVTELALIFWIRDSLLLNILMLLYPSDALRSWQMGH